MSLERTEKIAAASVPTPPPGKIYRFIDIADSLLKIKDEFGVVSVVSSQFGINGISNSYLSQVPTQTVKGRISSGLGDIEDLTMVELTSMLNSFTNLLKGLVPASGGGTDNFLRADGAFANPLPTVNEASATASFSTTSLTDVLITGMSITPGAGTYIVNFNSYHNNTNNGKTHTFSIYVNGVQQAETVREVDGSLIRQPIMIQSKRITVSAGQAIEVRMNVSANTGTVYERILTLIKVQ